MNGPKRARKHNSCGPKTDALRERILRVPSKQEFLKQTYKNKEDRPQHSPTQQLLALQGKAAKGIPAKGGDQANQRRNFNHSGEAALPEQFPESPCQRQPISAGRAALDLRHDQCRAKNHHERKHFVGERIAERKNTASAVNKMLENDSPTDSECSHESRINQQTPAAAQSFFVQKNLMQDSFGWWSLEGGKGRTVS